jgi:hypothetical protein
VVITTIDPSQGLHVTILERHLAAHFSKGFWSRRVKLVESSVPQNSFLSLPIDKKVLNDVNVKSRPASSIFVQHLVGISAYLLKQVMILESQRKEFRPEFLCQKPSGRQVKVSPLDSVPKSSHPRMPVYPFPIFQETSPKLQIFSIPLPVQQLGSPLFFCIHI